MNTQCILQNSLWSLVLLLLISCSDTDLNKIGTDDSYARQNAIAEIGAQPVMFNLKYDVPDGYRVSFEVYAENPLEIRDGLVVKKTNLSPVFTGFTNGRGEYKLSRLLPEQLGELYVYSSYVGVPSLQYGRIANGSVTFEEASLDKEEVQTKALFGRSDNYPYQTLGGWNSLGRPDYVTKKENVSSSLLQAINRAFPEWRSADQVYRKRTDLYVKEDAQIWVSLLHTSSLFDNVLGYFSYKGDIKNVDPASIKEIVAFPRANIVRLLSSGLKAGEAVRLKYYNPETGRLEDTFPAGTSIGWVLRSDGYNLLNRTIGDGKFRFYSYPEWNPESGNKSHTVLFKKDNFVVVGFEDLPNERINLLKGDGDCNDLMFHVSSYPADAITYDIPEIPDSDGETEETEDVDAIQQLSDVMDLPSDDPDFWNDLWIASKSTLSWDVSDQKDLDSYGSIVGLKEELIVANSRTMNSLIVDQPVATASSRIFVKTTIRRTKAADSGKKRIFVKTTVRGMTVYIEMEVDAYNMSIRKNAANEEILRKILSSRDKINANEPVRIMVEMEFDPIPWEQFEDLVPGPYSPHIVE
ncbi:DUF4114 domain-containing protein [uncultured Parabacteroides sp.]|uniref:DUF4114 domain-containing protein n=1 Tax=uncultured Parabacteroides sp. TaxID=512312 RepID=UPI0025CD4B46|nr:DUF4114 domain-containing protein [uncultured Parabacteroides sp.]